MNPEVVYESGSAQKAAVQSEQSVETTASIKVEVQQKIDELFGTNGTAIGGSIGVQVNSDVTNFINEKFNELQMALDEFATKNNLVRQSATSFAGETAATYNG